MADGLGKKVDLIWNKLRKLDSIPTETRLHNLHRSMASLEQSFAVMEKYVQNLKDKTGKTNTKVNDLEKSVEFHDQDISDLQKDLKKVQHEADELKMQLLDQGHYSRRENPMFVGNEENGTPFEDVENTKEVTYDFLQRELSFENAQSRFEFQRIHRVGKRTGKKPCPIIVRFLRYSDREDVLPRAKTSLEGKDYGVFEEMPKELYQLTKKRPNEETSKRKTSSRQHSLFQQEVSGQIIYRR